MGKGERGRGKGRRRVVKFGCYFGELVVIKVK